jgi:hypothetical protein
VLDPPQLHAVFPVVSPPIHQSQDGECAFPIAAVSKLFSKLVQSHVASVFIIGGTEGPNCTIEIARPDLQVTDVEQHAVGPIVLMFVLFGSNPTGLAQNRRDFGAERSWAPPGSGRISQRARGNAPRQQDADDRQAHAHLSLLPGAISSSELKWSCPKNRRSPPFTQSRILPFGPVCASARNRAAHSTCALKQACILPRSTS